MSQTEYVQYLSNGSELENAGWDGVGWYFWDETQAYCYGPFDTRTNAEEALKIYQSFINDCDTKVIEYKTPVMNAKDLAVPMCLGLVLWVGIIYIILRLTGKIQ